MFLNDQKCKELVSKTQRSISRSSSYQAFPKCGENHSGVFYSKKEGWFWCCQVTHMLKYCPSKVGQAGKICKANYKISTSQIGLLTKQGNSYVNVEICCMLSRITLIRKIILIYTFYITSLWTWCLCIVISKGYSFLFKSLCTIQIKFKSTNAIKIVLNLYTSGWSTYSKIHI